MKLKSGHEVIHSSEEENQKIKKDFPNLQSGTITLQPGGWHLLPPFLKYADRIYDFKYKPTDVVVITWPKCGTTWTQEIIWTMMHNADFKSDVSSFPVMFRSPFLEFDFIAESGPKDSKMTKEMKENFEDLFTVLCPGKSMDDGGMMLTMAEQLPDPRIIKTHLGFSLLHPDMLDTCKVVYVARNAKDACISYLHHHRLIELANFTGDLDTFVDYFVQDKLLHSPFWEHIKEGWERRDHKNLHWIFYEEMKRNPMEEIKRLNKFLGKNLSDENLKQILEYTKFDAMQKRDPMFSFFDTDKGNLITKLDYQKEKGNFFRKGISGDWRNHLNGDQNEKIEKWIQEKSAGIGIPFTY